MSNRIDRKLLYRIRSSAFVVCALALACHGHRPTFAVDEAEPGRVDFEIYEVATGRATSQAVLTGFLRGGPVADLVVVSVGEDGERRLRVYAFDGDGWEPKVDEALGAEVSFVDVAGVGGRDRLIAYDAGRLSAFDLESMSRLPLATVPSSFEPPGEDRIVHLDLTHDLNGDELDDLVLPDASGFWVFVQRSGGGFADAVKVGPPFERSRLHEGYRSDPWARSRVHEMDHDLDGRRDLVFWDGDRFAVHRQDEHGLFSPTASTFTTEVAFDSDDLSTLAAPYGVRRRRTDHNPSGELTGRVLHALTDMNGDGIADLVVFSLEGGSLWRMRSSYRVHFGESGPGGTVAFAAQAGAVVRSGGIPFAVTQHDFEPDGQVDVSYLTIEPGVFKAMAMIVRALVTGSVSVDLELYRMADGSYPEKPSARRKVDTVSLGESGEQASHFPAVLVADVTGDGRSDLLVQEGRDELRVFVGVPGPELFARRPQKVAVAMPGDETYTWLADLDRDGRQDIVMHHTSADGPQRVIVMLASSPEQEPGV